MNVEDLFLERAFFCGNYLALCTSEKLFEKVLDYIDIPKDDRLRWLGDGANATTHTIEVDGNNFSIVCVHPPPSHVSGIEVAALLVHEAVHIWQNKMAQIGEHNPSKEFEAYSIQAISMSLMNGYVAQMQIK